MTRRNNFTLIEVLVAGVIMTSVILLVTQAQRQNSLIMKKISSQQQRDKAYYFIKKSVIEEINERKLTGQNKWGEWSYSWRTKAETDGKTRANLLRPGQPKQHITLYEVTLILKKEEQEFEYKFKKTGWR